MRGKATGSKTAILPDDTLQVPSVYLEIYLFYDKFSRVVQTQSDNHLQGQDIIWNEYNYSGWLLKSLRGHSAIVDNCNKAVTIHQRHSYDHIGRLLQTYHQINEEEEVLTCEKSYNERDELAQKRLGVTALIESGNALQTVDYEYNIRKWLTKINDLSDTDDLFAMELKYTENIAGNFNNDINYNGNITAVEWKFQGEANSKIYSYEYDDLNRLETAVYGEHDGTNFLNKNRYNSAYSYDENGNILTLERKGLIQNNVFATIDNMSYSYTDDGRLQQIEETSQKARGFKTAASNGIAQYAYDANGNMIQDEHKEINVAYNYLNLPTSVEKTDEGDILWSYDATGKKLSKQVTKDSLLIIGNPIPNDEYNANLITSTGTVTAGSDVRFVAADSIVLKAGFSAKDDFLAKIGENKGKVRHYCNGIEYFKGEMESIYHEVGRVFFEENLPVYEYTLSDHLGNTRIVFRDDGTGEAQEIQKNDYYAFGLSFESQQNAYGYTFGHKEEQNELGLEWLDFGARCLARDIGRWLGSDPFANALYGITSYGYTINNPIKNTDPSGMLTENEDGLIIVDQSLYGREENENTGEVLSVTFLSEGQLSRDLTTYTFGGQENESNSDKGWKNLNKSDFRKYAQQTGVCVICTANELGSAFEQVFGDYMTSTYPEATTAHGFRSTNSKDKWTDAGTRNTIPDFTSDGGYYRWRFLPPSFKWIPVDNFGIYEVKNKSGGLYLSSNNNQVKGHIDNLAARHKSTIAKGGTPSFTLVTTANVKWSPSISSYAYGKKVSYNHVYAQYKVTAGGVWQFRFVTQVEGIFDKN